MAMLQLCGPVFRNKKRHAESAFVLLARERPKVSPGH